LTSIDQTAPLRGKDMDDEEQRWYLQSILFPPPSEERVRQVVYGTDWVSRLQQETKLAAPEALAPLIASSFAAGQSHRELAKTLLPIVDGVKSSARRIARTEGMRVAHTLQMDSSRALDDLIIGYQVNATLDNYTRPLHRHRNGTIYYVHPTGHQPGLDQMPHPPIEADGTVAHNCRCWTSPVLSPPAHLVNDPSKLAVFQAAAARTQPSPLVFSDWFTDAPEKLRRSAVGSSRYSLVRDLARVREPSYEHFVNPATGQLMTKQQLAAESTEARRARVRRVRALLAKRREDLATVLTHGFLPGKRPASATLAT
jgi:SPP1 gp7 family putative phage head morphogenesis protein